MARAVFDVNVLISSLIRKGKPRALWNKVVDGKVRLVISERILSEFDEVARRPKLRKYLSPRCLGRFTRVLIQTAEIADVRVSLPQLTEDPEDNVIVETAVDGGADYIVSGDRHLISLRRFRGIEIVTVDEMLKLIEKEEG